MKKCLFLMCLMQATIAFGMQMQRLKEYSQLFTSHTNEQELEAFRKGLRATDVDEETSNDIISLIKSEFRRPYTFSNGVIFWTFQYSLEGDGRNRATIIVEKSNIKEDPKFLAMVAALEKFKADSANQR